MAALASVEYRCSDLRWCYLQQTVHFFQSDTHAVIPNKLAFTSLHWRDSDLIMINLRRHDSNKYQTKAFVICDHKSHQTRSATYVNKTYLVWLMYWLLFNQHYQDRINQKPRSWTNAVFQNRGVCGQAFPSLPSSSPVIPFFCSRPNFLDKLARKRLPHRVRGPSLGCWLCMGSAISL